MSAGNKWINWIQAPRYYVDEDYPAGSGIIEPPSEQSTWRGSESSTLENDVYVWWYALKWVVHARNEWMNEADKNRCKLCD